jgi:hypothetical protein
MEGARCNGPSPVAQHAAREAARVTAEAASGSDPADASNPLSLHDRQKSDEYNRKVGWISASFLLFVWLDHLKKSSPIHIVCDTFYFVFCWINL